jgi:hypothetical protein
MYIFVFDRCGTSGIVPNLITNANITAGSDEWAELCLTPPFSGDVRLIQYLTAAQVPYSQILVDEVNDATGQVLYPIDISIFDPSIDYLALVSDRALQLCRSAQLTLMFYYSGTETSRDMTPVVKQWCVRYSLPTTGIKFITDNAKLNSGHFCYFPHHEANYRHLHATEKKYVRHVNPHQRSKKFTCLNRTDKGFRKLFAGSLWYHGVVADGHFSYSGIRYQKEYQEVTQDPVRWWDNCWEDSKAIMDNFDLLVPFSTDALSDPQHLDQTLIDHRFYTDAYWNYVTESQFNRDTVRVTEKTFKPILNLQPFIIVGSAGSLKLLRDLGYQTFDEWIDEDYDQIKDDEERMRVCFEMAYELADMSHTKHIAMMKEMMPILAHNQQVLLGTKRERYERLLAKLLGR